MPNDRPAIPAEITREILIESGHRCAVCGTGIPLERAHIIPWHKSKEHKVEDLICLCANCHERADKEKWGAKTLREYKQRPWVMRQYEKADDTLEPTEKARVEVADDRQNQATLEAYFDRMTELLLEKGLRESGEDDEVRSIARTRTLAVLRSLDGGRKGQVVRFLYESGLIGPKTAIVSLSGADLGGVDLYKASLSGADLSKANLSGADLRWAFLSGANLNSANLSGADMTWINLNRANLAKAALSEANLTKATLSEANLNRAILREIPLPDGTIIRGADLTQADLSWADLTRAEITDKQLAQAWWLTGATLPNGRKALDEAMASEHTRLPAAREKTAFVAMKRNFVLEGSSIYEFVLLLETLTSDVGSRQFSAQSGWGYYVLEKVHRASSVSARLASLEMKGSFHSPESDGVPVEDWLIRFAATSVGKEYVAVVAECQNLALEDYLRELVEDIKRHIRVMDLTPDTPESITIQDAKSDAGEIDRTELRRILVDRFDETELRELFFDLGIEYDSLSGEGTRDKAMELIGYCERRERLDELVEKGKQLRPDVSWPDRKNEREIAESVVQPVLQLRPGGAKKPHLLLVKEKLPPLEGPPFYMPGWTKQPVMGGPMRAPHIHFDLYLENETSRAGRNVYLVIRILTNPTPTRCEDIDQGVIDHGDRDPDVGDFTISRQFPEDLVVYQSPVCVGALRVHWNADLPDSELPKKVLLDYKIHTLDGVSHNQVVLFVKWRDTID